MHLCLHGCEIRAESRCLRLERGNRSVQAGDLGIESLGIGAFFCLQRKWNGQQARAGGFLGAVDSKGEVVLATEHGDDAVSAGAELEAVGAIAHNNRAERFRVS